MVAKAAKPVQSGSLAASCVESGERHPWSLFALITLIWLPAAVSVAIARRLWYDELFTYHLSQLGSISELWQALRHGVDLQPPLLFLVTRFSERMLGLNELGLRAQAILFFAIAALCLFAICKRKLGVWYGGLAVGLLLVSAAYPYATEARPYAMLLAFSSLALLCWIHYQDSGRSRLLIGLTAVIALMVSTQYYGALAVLPLWAAETFKWRQTRRLDPKILAATFAGLLPVLLYFPLIQAAIALHGLRPWNPVTLRSFADIYSELITPMAVPVALIALLLFLRPQTIRHSKWTLSAETVAIASYVALPIPALVAAYFGSHMIYWRYLMPAVLGLLLIGVRVLYQLAGGMRAPAAFAASVCLLWFVYLHGRDYQKLLGHLTSPAAFALRVPGNELPIVVNSPLDYLPAFHYANAALKSRLVYVADPELAARIAGTDAVEKNITSAGPYFGLHLASMREFEHRYPDFLLYVGPSTLGWFARHLIDQGASLQVYSRDGQNFVYLCHTSFLANAGPEHSSGRR